MDELTGPTRAQRRSAAARKAAATRARRVKAMGVVPVCSSCGDPRDTPHSTYCRKCHAAQMREWRRRDIAHETLPITADAEVATLNNISTLSAADASKVEAPIAVTSTGQMLTPAEHLLWRLVAARDRLARAVAGDAKTEPMASLRVQPIASQVPPSVRRFFAVVSRVVDQIEAEAAQIEAQSQSVRSMFDVADGLAAAERKPPPE